MASITLQGNPMHTKGELPTAGNKASDFKMVGTDLGEVRLSDFVEKRVVLNIFPSIDTGTCAASVRRFNQEASKLDDVVILCVSKDLPFAHGRFCGAEGIDNVLCLSDFRSDAFSEQYGVGIVDGPLAGLLSRAIVIIDKDGSVLYTEQVSEIVDEPSYEGAMSALGV